MIRESCDILISNGNTSKKIWPSELTAHSYEIKYKEKNDSEHLSFKVPQDMLKIGIISYIKNYSPEEVVVFPSDYHLEQYLPKIHERKEYK